MDGAEIFERLITVEGESKQHGKDIDTLTSKVDELDNKVDNLNKISTSIEVIATNMTYMKDDIKQVKNGQTEMKAEIAEIKEMPQKVKAKHWDKVISYIATAVGSGLLAYLLATICPQIFGK